MIEISPFPPGYRSAGVLLHVTSLPSAYGIGDLGPSAFSWIDRLHDTGIGWWQGLPLGPTGYGNSPYQSLSSFAGNDLLISPDHLVSDGLLLPEDCQVDFMPKMVDFGSVIPFKRALQQKAWRRFESGARKDLRAAFEEFCTTQAHWLEDYALFRALKAKYGGSDYHAWPNELVHRGAAALAQAKRELQTEIDQEQFTQFLFFQQAGRLKDYAHLKGLSLIGDLPFFVSADSCDVWAHPEWFLLDRQLVQRFVAGVPPDSYSATGQLWGNPVYNWDALGKTGYRWSIDRVRALLSHVDLIRLDHFRGFAAAWHVPAGSSTAESGEWVPGPGAAFFTALKKELGGLPIIAEDLGLITSDVIALRDEFKLAGTRILQFAFDGHADNAHLPRNVVSNTVFYTGNHDDPTTREWYEALTDSERLNLWSDLKHSPDDASAATAELLRQTWMSQAALAIAPLQDILNLGEGNRMNTPGRAGGNWSWRCSDKMLSGLAFQWLKDLTGVSKRRRG